MNLQIRVIDAIVLACWIATIGLAIGGMWTGLGTHLFGWSEIVSSAAAALTVIAWVSRRLAQIQHAYAIGQAARELTLVSPRDRN